MGDMRGVTRGSTWIWMAVLAALSILGGLLALLNPFVATMATVVLLGWMFAVLGVVQIVHAFADRAWGGFFWALLFGAVTLLLGLSLIFDPLAGMVSLTFLLGVLLVLAGIAKMVLGMAVRPIPGWGGIVFSGAISVLLAVMIFANFPWSAAAVLGILLAVELLSNGVLFLFVALGLRRM
ncbi:DUF308 domain-containing protein [Oricola sp.]|uniref:HdeD family acid-resistance protein n=1 Tax=Oricola sp. TaxID=1979950 RepID=UPI0025E0EFA9|nr:DUF308 domain-containing protein [Oricola sp.]MCI5075925.1 DUF308 domain-containing protein [Oricola sp.]